MTRQKKLKMELNESQVRERHKVRLGRNLLKMLIVILTIGIYSGLFSYLCEITGLFNKLGVGLTGRMLAIICFCGVFVAVAIIYFKRFFIWLVKVYQWYAPEALRQSCLFEPTCSEYMILVINKNGTLKGIAKGIIRLLHCHYPNGGVDYP